MINCNHEKRSGRRRTTTTATAAARPKFKPKAKTTKKTIPSFPLRLLVQLSTYFLRIPCWLVCNRGPSRAACCIPEKRPPSQRKNVRNKLTNQICRRKVLEGITPNFCWASTWPQDGWMGPTWFQNNRPKPSLTLLGRTCQRETST